MNEISTKKVRIVRLLVFGAIVCLVFVALSIFVFLKFKTSLEWIFFISAIYIALYFYFAWITYKSKLFIKADRDGIDFKFSIRSNSKNYFLWDSVSKVRIGYAYLAFYKKSGRRRKIQLGWLPYVKVVDIKEKVIEMCEDRSIKFEMADFIRYSEKKDIKQS